MKFFRALIAFFALISVAFAQQNDQPKPTQKKPATAEKPAETTSEPAEQRPAENLADKGKEEHFDMTETSPVITRHQTTVDGKLLKYTATAGRLPIERADGKIEAEMFYVAYTLDGQDPA
jgi:carboxypeptidase C (cathepsin A)